MQGLRPNFSTDSIRNSIYSKNNGDNAKIRIFSFIPERQRIQLYSIRTFIPTKQLKTQAQPEQPRKRHKCGFH